MRFGTNVGGVLAGRLFIKEKGKTKIRRIPIGDFEKWREAMKQLCKKDWLLFWYSFC